MDNNSGMDKEILINQILENSKNQIIEESIIKDIKLDNHRFSFCPPEAMKLQKEKLNQNKDNGKTTHLESIDIDNEKIIVDTSIREKINGFDDHEENFNKFEFNNGDNEYDSENQIQNSPQFRNGHSIEFENERAKKEKNLEQLDTNNVKTLEKILNENYDSDDEDIYDDKQNKILSSPDKRNLENAENDKDNILFNGSLNNIDVKSLGSPGNPSKENHQTTESKNNLFINSKKGAILFESVQERKGYEEKVIILKTRLKKLKEQEEELNKRLNVEKKKVIKVDKIRDGVNENKKKIQIEREQRKKDVEKLKKELVLEREQRKQKLNEAKETVKKEKEKLFKSVKNDRIVLNSLAESFKSQTDNMKNYNYYKNKQEEIASKVQRFQKYKEKEDQLKEKFDSRIVKENKKTFDLKKKLEKLEEMEVEYMKKLENTIIRNRVEMDNLQKTKGINVSTVSLKIKSEILHKSDTNIMFESPIQKIQSGDNLESEKKDDDSSNKKSSENNNIIKKVGNNKHNSAFNNLPKKLSLVNKINNDKKLNNHQNNIRKTNSIATFDKNGKEPVNKAMYRSYLKSSNKNSFSIENTVRKNASMTNNNYKTTDDKMKKDFNKIIIKSLNTTSPISKEEYSTNDLIKKINFDNLLKNSSIVENKENKDNKITITKK